VGVDQPGPETDSQVWLAPRAVQAASVANSAGEAEKYVFYRGVGNLDAPLRVVRDAERDTLTIHEQIDPALNLSGSLSVPALWLVDIRDDRAVAFRTLEPAVLMNHPNRALAEVPARFDDSSYSSDNLQQLRTGMRTALIADGLFEDEAEAMLNTWESAYFRTSGMRLFFLLPQQWTHAVLPLETSVEADIVRTMVGRIEIVTPRQRELLRQISLQQDFDRQHYQALGRFRDALILDAQAQDADAGLQKLIKAYGIRYYGLATAQ
jgi:hypothetical protein